MFVYFIQSGIDGPIKIGKANDIEKRRQDLQVGNPMELTVLLAIPCKSSKHAEGMEKQIHRRFKRSHIRGEWFSLGILNRMKELDWRPPKKGRKKPSLDRVKHDRQEARINSRTG